MGFLGNFFRKKKVKSSVSRVVKARYDASMTNHMNVKHWANSDSLSADEANNPQVRQVLRDRARYETANDTYLGGMVDTMAEAVIGTGPRLQYIDDDPEVAEAVEKAFHDWFEGIDGANKLLVSKTSQIRDGESFMIETNSVNEFSPVTLDYMLVEAERCTSQFLSNQPNNIDGVILKNNKVVGYNFLKYHPGGNVRLSVSGDDFLTFNADEVLHLFKQIRAEQHRGIPEIMSALPIGAKRRGFALSTIEAANIAATFSGVLETTGSGNDDEDSEGDDEYGAFEAFPLERGLLTSLPEGYQLKQMSAEHPTTTYDMFNRAMIAEAARSFGMPVNVALGDSSKFNFSSGRLDMLRFRKRIKIQRRQVERVQLRRMFFKFFEEAKTRSDLLPLKAQGTLDPKFSWFWDGDDAIDPVKEATANDKALKNGSMTFAEVYGERGVDWQAAMRQRKREQEFAKKIGLTLDPDTTNEPEEELEEDENNQPEPQEEETEV